MLRFNSFLVAYQRRLTRYVREHAIGRHHRHCLYKRLPNKEAVEPIPVKERQFHGPRNVSDVDREKRESVCRQLRRQESRQARLHPQFPGGDLDGHLSRGRHAEPAPIGWGGDGVPRADRYRAGAS
jgi:hypothetical protein